MKSYQSGAIFAPLFTILIIISSSTTHASFVGSTLELTGQFQSTSTSTPSFWDNPLQDQVGAGIEFTSNEISTETILPPNPNVLANPVPVSIDVSANSVLIDFSNSSPFSLFATAFENTYILTDVFGTVPSIIGVSIDSSVTTLGLSLSDITFDENTLRINVSGLPFNINTIAKIDVQFVPIPTAIWFFITGLFGLIGFSKRIAA